MSIPPFVINLLNDQYKSYEVEKILEGFSKKRVTTLRVNTLKTSKEEVIKCFDAHSINYQVVENFPNALYVYSSISDITALDIYHQGYIYLQSLSSQLPPLLLNPKTNSDILDMAAAPGGKTTMISSLLSNNCSIIACEPNKIRFERLKHNCNVQGATCVNLQNIDALKLDDYFSFDYILLDAPCSGSGTLSDSLDNKISKELVINSSILQKKLINKACKMLKKGGYLMYSTCSIFKKENEDVVNTILKSNNFEVVDLNQENLLELPKLETSINGSLLIMPTEFYEGFYLCLLRKIN